MDSPGAGIIPTARFTLSTKPPKWQMGNGSSTRKPMETTMGIDWDKLETMRTAKAPEKQLPAGYFRSRDYAEREGIAVDAASKRLKRLAVRGEVEREKFGSEYAYRIKAQS
jgi:hypothetical protein